MSSADSLSILFMRQIGKQKAAIRKIGIYPSWEVFANSLGWHQQRQDMTEEMQQLYETLWRQVQ